MSAEVTHGSPVCKSRDFWLIAKIAFSRLLKKRCPPAALPDFARVHRSITTPGDGSG